MVRHRYNYSAPSAQDTKGKDTKGKEGRTKQQHHNQNTTSRKPKGQFLSQKMAKRLSKLKKNHQDIHAQTYNDRNSKPQQKHRLLTISNNLTGSLKSRGFCGSTLSTYDLSTLYITLPHSLIKERLTDVNESLFKGLSLSCL